MAEEEMKETPTESGNNVADDTAIATQPDTETVQAEVKAEGGDGSTPSPSADAAVPTDDPAPPVDEGEISQHSESEPKNEDKCQQMKVMLDSAVQQILSAFKGLQESFDGKLRYDAKKDGIIDRQFQELSQFKSGLVEKVTMQIVNDLIGEIDSAQKLVKFYENAECNDANFKKLQKVLRDIPASLCDVLEKYGVTSYSSTVGAAFNPKRQRALKTTETGDIAKDKTVRELLRLGFEQELDAKDDQPAKMKILRSEMVDVFVFNPALATVPAVEKQETTQSSPEEPAETSASKVEQ